LTIFHAFDWRIHSVKWKLDELRSAGYDAVQISPLQKSIGDQQWWEATNSEKFSTLVTFYSKYTWALNFESFWSEVPACELRTHRGSGFR
jgi:hypothetical protein